MEPPAKAVVLDLETKRSFEEVGGAQNKAALGVSVAGLYRYADDAFVCFREDALDALADELRAADAVVGFNLVGFDLPVLAAEVGAWVLELPTVDLMLEAQRVLGHRIGLDAVARATLGAGKIGSGLDALEYYRAGDWERLERYCLEDVKITRDVYGYALEHGHVLYERPQRGRFPSKPGVIPMTFAPNPLVELFHRAARSRSSVRMTYKGAERLVDVRAFDGVIIKGYCHLKRASLSFRIDRVEAAEEAPSSTPLF